MLRGHQLNNFKKAIKLGAAHIISANFINKVLQFATSIVLVRFMSKSEYGTWSYSMNIMSFFLLFNGLGAANGTLQFCSRAKDINQKRAYLLFGYKLGISANFIIGLLIIAFTAFYTLPIANSNSILRKIAFIPLLTILYNVSGNGLRANFANKRYSILAVLNTFLFFVGSVLGIYFFKINGLIAGRYLAYILTAILSGFFLKEYLLPFTSTKNIINKIEFIKFSSLIAITNATSSILYLLDTFFVGLILKSGISVASYKAAMIIPFSLIFLPKAILTFAYPYFAKNYNNIDYVIKYYKKMFKSLLLINSVITLFLVIFAKLIILIIFGEKYLSSVTPFRILALNFFIVGSFRVPAGNVLASLNKIKINFYIAIISGLSNIVLDIFFIKKYGNNGAAIATLLVMIISSFLSNYYLFRYFKTKRLEKI